MVDNLPVDAVSHPVQYRSGFGQFKTRAYLQTNGPGLIKFLTPCAGEWQHVSLKADSHIACRAHAAPMPFPCHAAPPSCSDSVVSFVKFRVVAGNIRTASTKVCLTDHLFFF